MKSFFLLGVVYLIGCSIVYSQNKKPNIIFIYSDDQALWTLGFSGNFNAHTPNLDRLAHEGAFLKNSFVTTPVCSPARASLMTGQYASEYGILDFIPQPGHVLYDPKNPIGLNPESTTFAEVLQKNGYTTGLIGKWHLGDWTEKNDKKYHPTNHGFDYFMGLTGGGTSPVDAPLEKNGVVKKFKGLTTDILTDEAITFIEDNKSKPFLISLNYRAPHAEWLPVAPEDWAPYDSIDPILPNPNYPDLDKEKVKRKMREYLASVTGVDRNIGRVLNVLDSLRLSQNTIVIFSSDHGYNMGHNGIEHKGNGVWITKSLPEGTKNVPAKRRPNLYDNSLKVPSIVKWPDKIAPGTIVNETTTNLDWYPTILEMAGLEVPQNKVVRGRSILPLLKGENLSDWNNDFYSEYSMNNYAKSYMRSYRTTDWKLTKDFNNPERDELYNVSKDPEENINMIYDSREDVKNIRKGLENKIIKQMKKINDPLLKSISETSNN